MPSTSHAASTPFVRRLRRRPLPPQEGKNLRRLPAAGNSGNVGSMPRHCYVLRVFTRRDEGGNHLGVVTDVSGLTDEAMQGIAAELGFSETIFVDWRRGGVPTARIFTPGRELPFAGHPLVGAGWVLLAIGPGGVDRIACGVGEVAVRRDGDTVWIRPPFDQEVSRSRTSFAGWADPLDAWEVRMPLPYQVVELATPDDVAGLSPPDGLGEVYAWAWQEEARAVKARFFAVDIGVVEDPATGSAAVALAAVLRHTGRRTGDVVISQGDEIGHPSTLRVRWSEGGVEVGGTVRRDEVRELET